MDILRMLEDLEEITVDRPKSLGPLLWGYSKDEVQMQIAKIRASMPLEIKQAANLTRESERVVEQAREDAQKTIEGAQREAERILAEAKQQGELSLNQAKLEQERMLSENEIIKIAKAQADEIRSEADREASNMRRGAEDYAYMVLTKLESGVGNIMSTIDKSKAEIRPVAELAVVQPREKVKVGN